MKSPVMPTCIAGPLYDYDDPRNDLSLDEWNERSICNHEWDIYNDILIGYENKHKLLAGLLVHEAKHAKQFNNPFMYTLFAGLIWDRVEFQAYLQQADALKKVGYTLHDLSVEGTYEVFLRYFYESNFGKPMPDNDYKTIFGKDPEASTRSLTMDMPQEVKEALDRLSHGHTDPVLNSSMETEESSTAGSTTPSPNYSNIGETDYLIVVEVRNTEDVTLYLELVNVTSDNIDVESENAFWTPEQVGNLEIRTFAISGLESPQVLSPVTTINSMALPDNR